MHAFVLHTRAYFPVFAPARSIREDIFERFAASKSRRSHDSAWLVMTIDWSVSFPPRAECVPIIADLMQQLEPLAPADDAALSQDIPMEA